ncbi:hypothetical protein EYF80_041013 [Liparis tanakae]|uniref:Uncharacterized protein n=1 Tax=Liparis tanakae TaxID=230148 RepID=A0A4Z2G7K5_9TELE|nr:hypothetical protein EYF80_041013 [Liparis tanakae]
MKTVDRGLWMIHSSGDTICKINQQSPQASSERSDLLTWDSQQQQVKTKKDSTATRDLIGTSFSPRIAQMLCSAISRHCLVCKICEWSPERCSSRQDSDHNPGIANSPDHLPERCVQLITSISFSMASTLFSKLYVAHLLSLLYRGSPLFSL